MPTTLQAKGLTTPKRATPARAVKLADEGIVVAIVAVTGVVDAVDDLIVPGAFAATLKLRRPKVVDDHEWQRKVGRVLHAEEWMPGDARLPKRTKEGRPWPAEAGALVATMQYNLATERGRESFADVKFYAESNEAEFSIGYKVPDGKARKRSDGVRVILAVNLFEFSHVLFGAAPLSMALSVKSMHAGSAGTATAASLGKVEETDEFPDDQPPPPVDTDAAWDDEAETKKRAGVECKTALDVLLEVKSASLIDTPATDTEVKAMSNMKGSYEERRNLIEVAARDLFEATYADPCVCVVATYDTEAVVTVYTRDEARSFVMPYTATAAGIELGEPSPVELSLVAEPAAAAVEGETIADPETVEQVTVVQPAYDAAAFAATVIRTFEAGTTERKAAAAAMKAHLGEVLGLSAKAADAEEPPGVVEADGDTITRETLPEGDWAKYHKTAPIEAIRMEAPFTVQTREGVVECADGWLAIDSDGYPYPIDADEFAAVYAPGDTATQEAPEAPAEPVDAPAPTEPASDPEAPSQAALDAAYATENTKSADDPDAPPAADEADPDARVTLDPDEHFDTLADLETTDDTEPVL